MASIFTADGKAVLKCILWQRDMCLQVGEMAHGAKNACADVKKEKHQVKP
jgi:hypothetical protein